LRAIAQGKRREGAPAKGLAPASTGAGAFRAALPVGSGVCGGGGRGVACRAVRTRKSCHRRYIFRCHMFFRFGGFKSISKHTCMHAQGSAIRYGRGRGRYAITTPERAETFAPSSWRSIPASLVGLCVFLDPLPHLGFEGLREEPAWENLPSEEVTTRDQTRERDITGRSSLNNFATSGTSCQPKARQSAGTNGRQLVCILLVSETAARHADRRIRRQQQIPDCSGWGRSIAYAGKE